MVDCPEDPEAEDHQEERQGDPQEDGQVADHQTRDPLEAHRVVTPQTNRRERTSLRAPGDGSCTLRGRTRTWRARRRSTRSRSTRALPFATKAQTPSSLS